MNPLVQFEYRVTKMVDDRVMFDRSFCWEHSMRLPRWLRRATHFIRCKLWLWSC